MFTPQLSEHHPCLTFDIRNFTDRLTSAKGANRYHCPVCEGNNLTVAPKTGKYKCWSGCECKDIRQAISREESKNFTCSKANSHSYKLLSRGEHFKLPKPVAIPNDAKLVKLPRFATDSPQPQKPAFIPKRVIRQVLAAKSELNCVTETTYQYSETQTVHRFDWEDATKDKGRDKTFIQSHIASDGKKLFTKGDYPWSAYRLDEAIAAAKAINATPTISSDETPQDCAGSSTIASDETPQDCAGSSTIASDETPQDCAGSPVLLQQEGEGCVEIARAIAIANFTFQGSGWTEAALLSEYKRIKEELATATIAFLHDPDEAGLKKALLVEKCCAKAGLGCILINPHDICPDLPYSQSDIKEILGQMDETEFIRRLEAQIHAAVNEKQQLEEESYNDDWDDIPDSLDPNITFLQQAFNFLYGDKPWISADNKLYFHTGNHYKHSPDSTERPRIASFCNTFVVFDKQGKISYPYANPGKVRELLQWVKDKVEIEPTLLNPVGINCTNGVVKVKWENGKPVHYLDKHTPKDYFIYEPLVKYDPDADTTECDRLLECLDEAQQQVLLRNLAASIDLPEVRKRRGREVKLLLACGLGSNGKDSLREVVSTIYGHTGMTSISLADFAHYDDGRKFALAPLMSSRVNWASENPQTAKLDKIQSLKLFATGNNLHCERKGKDHIEFIPNSVGIFNLNETPSLLGTTQATVDRIAALEFRKTYKKNPDPTNPLELKADPRFAYDSEFIRTHVAPAFLNKMLDALSALISEGIDYECTTDAFRVLQKENNHLFQFIEDTGIDYQESSQMSAKEIWALLEQWYINDGTLEIDVENKRRSWVERARPSDKNVKGINQVIPRILALFPKANKSTRYDEIAKRNIPTILGIGIIENSRTTIENSRTISALLTVPEITQSQDSRTTRTTFADISEVEKIEDTSTNPVSPELNLWDAPEEKNVSATSATYKEEIPPKTGAGGAEQRNINTDECENRCDSGAGDVETGAGNFSNPSLLKMMINVWADFAALGQLVLAASEEELQAVAANCTPEQIAHIKDAANSVWQPGFNRDADYVGERVEIWEVSNQKREITVRAKSGSKMKVKRGNINPWLGI